MNSGILIVILLLYLGLLFFIAQWAERKGNSKWTNNPYIYSLSLAVYCTTWTYYGSIGVAANSGLNYIPIYLGPVIAFPAWIIILKKIIRISRVNKISSIADFISLRYGNSRFLGALVTLISLMAILPYVGLQLKAISETFHIVTNSPESNNVFLDTSTYVALVLALFASFYGNFALLVRAYAYMLLLGEEGLRAVSNHAVLNANYIKERLKSKFHLAFDRICMHEAVFTAKHQAERGVHAMDIAKFLIDQGFHPPTVYFPITVKESIMIEPTETESKTTMDQFIDAMFKADEVSLSDPDSFHSLPKTTPISRPDEVKAARELNTNYFNQKN